MCADEQESFVKANQRIGIREPATCRGLSVAELCALHYLLRIAASILRVETEDGQVRASFRVPGFWFLVCGSRATLSAGHGRGTRNGGPKTRNSLKQISAADHLQRCC